MDQFLGSRSLVAKFTFKSSYWGHFVPPGYLKKPIEFIQKGGNNKEKPPYNSAVNSVCGPYLIVWLRGGGKTGTTYHWSTCNNVEIYNGEATDVKTLGTDEKGNKETYKSKLR